MQSSIGLMLCLTAASCLADSCNDKQLNKAKLRFKDCLEDKKAYLLQLDYEQEEDMNLLICSGLKELSTGCTEAVNEFSYCLGREHVDHLVEIHLNAISDVLAPFHPTIELRDCPVFDKPSPVIHKKPEPAAAAAAEPEYQSVTGGCSTIIPSAVMLLLASIFF